MILLDVNILVQAHREDADRHGAIRPWLESYLDAPSGVAVSELVLSGCLRVITIQKFSKNLHTPAEAVAFTEAFRSRASVHVLTPGPRHWEIFSDLCRRLELRSNFIPDAYHAALAIESGCEWETIDRGFARFPGLRGCNPLDSSG